MQNKVVMRVLVILLSAFIVVGCGQNDGVDMKNANKTIYYRDYELSLLPDASPIPTLYDPITEEMAHKIATESDRAYMIATYNEKGQIIELKKRPETLGFYWTKAISYHANGRPHLTTTTNNKGTIGTTEFDVNGKVVRRESIPTVKSNSSEHSQE